jgi:hypothetical protein
MPRSVRLQRRGVSVKIASAAMTEVMNCANSLG